MLLFDECLVKVFLSSVGVRCGQEVGQVGTGAEFVCACQAICDCRVNTGLQVKIILIFVVIVIIILVIKVELRFLNVVYAPEYGSE